MKLCLIAIVERRGGTSHLKNRDSNFSANVFL